MTPDGWVEATLGDVVALRRRRVMPVNLGIDVVTHYSIPAFDELGGPVRDSASSIKSHKFIVEEDAVLLSLLNPRIPRFVCAEGSPSTVCSTEFAVMTPVDESVTLGFLNLLVSGSGFRDRLNGLVSGTTGSRKRVKPDQCLGLPLKVPPLDEQRRIVSVVGSVDATIESAEVHSESLVRVRHGLVSDLLRPKEGWDRKPAGEAFEVRMGRQRSPKHRTGKHLMPYLRAANVKDGWLALDDVKEMNFNPTEQATFHLEPGDVLVTEGCGSIAELGASARWEGHLPGTVCFQNTLVRLRAQPETTISGFVELWARHAHQSGAFAAIASGTNIFHIGSTRLSTMPVDVPTVEEQQRIVDLVGSVDGAIDAAGVEIDHLRRLRAGMLEQLLSGSYRIPESYEKAVGL